MKDDEIYQLFGATVTDLHVCVCPDSETVLPGTRCKNAGCKTVSVGSSTASKDSKHRGDDDWFIDQQHVFIVSEGLSGS